MIMTESEIRKSYCNAAKPGKQVRILAQLNACPAKRIVEILAACGIEAHQPEPHRETAGWQPEPHGKTAGWPPETYIEQFRLYCAGMSRAQIALRFGCHRNTVNNHLKKMLALPASKKKALFGSGQKKAPVRRQPDRA